MRNKVATFQTAPDSTYGQRLSPRPSAPGVTEAPAALVEDNPAADLRLVIEEDEANGSYVYKTVNRRTGEIVLRMPRDELLQLRKDDDYIAGDVIRTKA